ncbi:MAG TPA: DUF4202 domain-containing protein [Alphaproteobacteria bacterium]|nr:DUF4202 domain-containing protein [Alphaproteobacteria bacterium]
MTEPGTSRFRAAIAAIDALNAEDPNRERGGEGEAPAALLYGRRMSAWLLRLAPGAPEPLRLAARAQHIARWKIPRNTYPQGRAGYLKWRRDLGRFHADTAAAILEDAGYGPDDIARVRDLLQKKALKRDADAQTLEDAACLVFLEHHFIDFSRKHEDEKVIDILRKTLIKMSDQGRAEAVTLAARLPADRRTLVDRAMAPEETDPRGPGN